MKKKLRLGAAALSLVLILTLLAVYATPQRRARRFIAAYSAQIEAALADGQDFPAAEALGGGCRQAALRDGTHPMAEFILAGFGGSYCGCYYSPDGVPLAFQNADVPLTPDGRGGWVWRAEGDNRGCTNEIAPCWYFFKATF